MPNSMTVHAKNAAKALEVLGRAGVARPYSPLKLARLPRVLSQWGTGPAGGFASLALREPGRVGLIDELGSLTCSELHRRSNALARGLAAQGVREGESVAIMCRNHRGFVDASIAVAKLGADALYLNTAFAGPQLAAVLERERPTVVIHDEEFLELLSKAEVKTRIVAWVEDGTTPAGSLEQLIANHDDSELTPPGRHSRAVILTSGTTGTPKGAPRSEPGIDAAVALMSRLPLRFGWKSHIAAPLFHTWGFAHFALAMLLGSTMVLRRRFDPEDCLQTLDRYQCESAVVIPVMLQRILALDEELLAAYSLKSVQVVAASGSALPGSLAVSWMDHFGDNLYNIYGSTEVAYASIATPADLREAPSSAGRTPHATVVKLFDEFNQPVPDGATGRIFVSNRMLFEGYSDGRTKETIEGLMATGDVGRFGDDGRLYVEGRDDDMIVSGGENVFPQEVEDCLANHDAVTEAAAIGVDDADFGKRLRAFVATKTKVSEDDLKAYVKDNLARYKVPREIIFVEELPRNSTGKVLKRDLVEWQEP